VHSVHDVAFWLIGRVDDEKGFVGELSYNSGHPIHPKNGYVVGWNLEGKTGRGLVKKKQW